MSTVTKPCSENNFLGDHAELLISSFEQLTGRPLIKGDIASPGIYRALYEAPFAVVSHNTDEDPVFNYGNRTALTLFEMNWEDFVNLPSRKSAQPDVRADREQLLARVTKYGYVDDYHGIRVSSTGK